MSAPQRMLENVMGATGELPTHDPSNEWGIVLECFVGRPICSSHTTAPHPAHEASLKTPLSGDGACHCGVEQRVHRCGLFVDEVNPKGVWSWSDRDVPCRSRQLATGKYVACPLEMLLGFLENLSCAVKMCIK